MTAMFQNMRTNIIWAYSTSNEFNTCRTLDSFIRHDFLQITVNTSEERVGEVVLSNLPPQPVIRTSR